jgi:hypothetical protein
MRDSINEKSTIPSLFERDMIMAGNNFSLIKRILIFYTTFSIIIITFSFFSLNEKENVI